MIAGGDSSWVYEYLYGPVFWFSMSDPDRLTHTGVHLTHVSESMSPPSGPPEQIPDPGLISLLRSELGLSSSDLFSMTVTDYDIAPSVRTMHSFIHILIVRSFKSVVSFTCSLESL